MVSWKPYRDLRKESAKAREYIGLRDRHRELEINITLKNIENIELKNEYIIDDIAELTSSIESCDEKKPPAGKEIS